jgi:cellulose synthase/poly-beta-1,6-N-acetylglucosamine synthase-like glycosyltransferase
VSLPLKEETTLTTPQVGYLAVTTVYLGFFLLFLRLFVWKRYADKLYWNRRPQLSVQGLGAEFSRRDQPLPFITVFVPAREEAMVIAETLEHLATVQYPSDRYEVVVVTDAREDGSNGQPTTQQVISQVQVRFDLRSGMPKIVHCEVPIDFDGRLGGKHLGVAVPSTKGRALNYAVAFASPQAEIYGFYDAESRPDTAVLLHVANRQLKPGHLLMQGPVFQVRNFYQLSILCKLAALYQAVSHEWHLPVLMRVLPFIGGTNFFVSARLFHEIGGQDNASITEDLEFGVRAYLVGGIWPEYLPVVGSEQTPASFLAFFRQRLRWGSGYLAVWEKYRRHPLAQGEAGRQLMRTLVMRGPVQWAVYQAAALLMPAAWIALSLGLLDSSILPPWANSILHATALVYLTFTFAMLARYRTHIDAIGSPMTRLAGAVQLLALPLGAFFLPTPYSAALVLRAFGHQHRTWVKTPRTRDL